ncbi:MAG: energy-coupling factor transporter ATPase [Clostridia bacterium]|nr:energy-coupling factor transporter ATPase [Clostridia bacterium]
MSGIEVKNVSVVYGAGTPFEKKALDNVSIDFGSDRVVGIIGHTGSGKSTLAMLLNGLNKPTEGTVLLGGEDIWARPKEISKVRFRVGLVFQYPEYQLFEETVYKDIAFGPKNMGMDEENLDRAVRNAAKFCGIEDTMLEKSPFELSGGQKRRVAIAGVAAMDPEVLVLDEPAAGLDPAGREEIIGGLLEYRKQRKSTMLIISHSMEDIARYADYIVVLDHGKVHMQGTPAEIFHDAERLFEASLDLPQVTKLFVELKKRALAEETDVYTCKEGVRRIKAIIEKRLTGEANA